MSRRARTSSIVRVRENSLSQVIASHVTSVIRAYGHVKARMVFNATHNALDRHFYARPAGTAIIL